ncbi:MAG: ABC transporter substrate-binding protein [Candidatus Methanomethylophilaceae archaeon]|jgi:ABC-type nitrate/sulfonate/bicarbonate transport system substrate-binding protein
MVSIKMTTILVVVIIIGASACYLVYDYNNSDGDSIKIAVANKNCYEPWWIADELGYFDEEGVDVQFMVVSGGGTAATALLAGQVDIAGMGPDPMLRVFSMDESYRCIARWQLDHSYVEGAVRGDIDLNDPRTLIGKTVGMDITTAYYSTFMSYLDVAVENNVLTQAEVDSIKILNFNFETIVTAILDGKADVIIAGSYNAMAADIREDDEIELSILSDASKEMYYSKMSVGLVASESAMESKSDDIVKVLRALQRACEYIYDNTTESGIREDACEIVVQVYGNTWTVDQQEKYFMKSEWGLAFDYDDVQSINLAETYLSDVAFIDFDIRDYFEPKYLQEILGSRFIWPVAKK